MNKVKLTLFTAGVALAMAFFTSCGGHSLDDILSLGESSSSNGGNGSLSSGGGRSSSNGPSSSACVNPSSYDSFNSVTIGEQTWMAENLNYAACGSRCYDNQESNCNTYGRLYDWVTAMALPASCYLEICASQITAKHRGVCPAGWHIPSGAEWGALFNAVGGASTAGTKLKATSGWNNIGNGTDDFGFAALPGSYGGENGNFDLSHSLPGYGLGDRGNWWSSTEGGSSLAQSRYLYYSSERVYWDNYVRKFALYSVRCVKD